MLYDIIIYKVITNAKVRFVRVGDGKIWDASTLALAVAPTYANTAIALTRDNYINGIPVKIPATLPAGDYDMLFYSAASPAYTDEVSVGKRIAWSGDALIGSPIDL